MAGNYSISLEIYVDNQTHTPPPQLGLSLSIFPFIFAINKICVLLSPGRIKYWNNNSFFYLHRKMDAVFLRVLNTKFSWLLQQFYQNRLFVGFAESMKNWTMFHFQLTLSTFHFEPYFCYFSFSSFFFLFKL